MGRETRGTGSEGEDRGGPGERAEPGEGVEPGGAGRPRSPERAGASRDTEAAADGEEERRGHTVVAWDGHGDDEADGGAGDDDADQADLDLPPPFSDPL
ncbi:hypothetical protein [Streptomyces sp. NPDC127108]|uniref:hypothetical protein n=1 Tax=Streptomyces sp. NPDC127108 TaxID=3345361 RepID=UPI0036346C96